LSEAERRKVPRRRREIQDLIEERSGKTKKEIVSMEAARERERVVRGPQKILGSILPSGESGLPGSAEVKGGASIQSRKGDHQKELFDSRKADS